MLLQEHHLVAAVAYCLLSSLHLLLHHQLWKEWVLLYLAHVEIHKPARSCRSNLLKLWY